MLDNEFEMEKLQKINSIRDQFIKDLEDPYKNVNFEDSNVKIITNIKIYIIIRMILTKMF